MKRHHQKIQKWPFWIFLVHKIGYQEESQNIWRTN